MRKQTRRKAAHIRMFKRMALGFDPLTFTPNPRRIYGTVYGFHFTDEVD